MAGFLDMPPSPDLIFLEALRNSLLDQRFQKLVYSRPVGTAPDLKQLRARPVTLRGEAFLSIVTRFARRDETRNVPMAEAFDVLSPLPGTAFRSAHLFTATESLQLDFSKKGRPLLKRHANVLSPEAPVHDRAKKQFLPAEAPWLHRMGVTDEGAAVRPSMSDKWKQINKFAEILDQVLPAAPPSNGPFTIVDFGCGRGLLTFAAYDRAAARFGDRAEVIGVELREHLTSAAATVAGDLKLEGLRFSSGDIADFPLQRLGGVIALHACDTATDLALHAGIRGGAEFILSSPCCHKEIRPQIQIPAVLRPMLRHGSHLGQEAEMLTDTLRMLLLESRGYRVRLVEFVSLEHTAKNKLIVAEKGKPNPEALAQFQELKLFYGIQTQQLERLLALHHLMEKQLATPEQYPPTLSLLVAACNQKSNRDPVLQLGTEVVEQTLNILRREKTLELERVEALESEVLSLKRQLHELQEAFQAFKQAFEG